MTEENVNIAAEVEKQIKDETENICFMCEAKEAKFCIKGKPKDCYCQECAKKSFGDTAYLENI